MIFFVKRIEKSPIRSPDLLFYQLAFEIRFLILIFLMVLIHPSLEKIVFLCTKTFLLID